MLYENVRAAGPIVDTTAASEDGPELTGRIYFK